MFRNFIRFGVFTAVSACAFSSFADEIQLPARKAGEWQITMNLGGKTKLPAMSVTICLDDKTDAEMMKAGLSLSKDVCTRQSMTRDGDALVIDSTCDFGAMKSTSHIVVSGDFQSAYTVKVNGTVEGGPSKMPKTTEMIQEARWVGATCTGLKPGEMLMPNGMKVDATRMMNGAKGG
jgi:hypothetical protein